MCGCGVEPHFMAQLRGQIRAVCHNMRRLRSTGRENEGNTDTANFEREEYAQDAQSHECRAEKVDTSNLAASCTILELVMCMRWEDSCDEYHGDPAERNLSKERPSSTDSVREPST
jgi:hypothetical protein